MIVRYNALNRFETPVFTLCQPGSTYVDGCLTKTVGALIDHEAEEIVFNFNALSELNMRINMVPREDPEENEYARGLFRAIQNRRLIYAENIGYFVITNVSDGYDDGVSYKDVTAKSVDAELQQKMIPYIADGTYRFSTDSAGEHKGIFETIVETFPLWTIGHVDTSVASKWRTFEDVDTSLNCLAFLIDNVQDAYECIIVFDIIHRIINVYARDNYVRQTDIHITKNDLINSIDVNENADDIYTAINALGGDSISIAAVNPLGTNVIYAFDYYLSWMSNSLKTKVSAWQSAVAGAFNEHYQLSKEYYQQLELVTNFEQDIVKINTQITMYGRCRDNIVAQSSTDIVNEYNAVIEENGGTAISIDKEIDATLQEIDRLIGECNKSLSDVQTKLNAANQIMAAKKSSIDKIHDNLSIVSYFTEEEYTELSLYIYEGSYSDEYVVITESMSYEEKFEQMKLLYDRAKLQLDKVSVPTQEFNIDVESFIFMKDFAEWSEQLETGCLINVELDVNDIAAIFLASITVNYDDRSMKLTFGNRYNKFDPKSLFDNMLGNISKSANTLNYIKEAIYPIKNGEFSAIREVLQTSRDLTMNSALAATNEEVVIDASGYTGKRLLSNGEYDDRQIKIVSNSIVFTEDGWDSCSLALGNIILDDSTSIYGINARAIFGNMIIGGGLKIYDKNGNEMLSVLDSINTRVWNAEGKVSTLEQTVDGFNTRVWNAEGKVSTLEQKVDGLTFSVSNGETSSILSLKSGGITLTSEEIKMTGVVSFTDLSTSGNTRIHGGNIITGTITADRIDSNFISALNLEVGKNVTMGPNAVISWNNISDKDGVATKTDVTTITNNAIKTASISANQISTGTLDARVVTITHLTVDSAQIQNLSADKITSGENNASITFNGTFTAPNAVIKGEITATSGAIGGWSLSPNLYGYQLTSGTPGSSGFIGLYTAYDTDENYRLRIGTKFSVDSQGNLNAAGGKIAGWTIENERFYYNNEIDSYTVVGKESVQFWSGNESFRVIREPNDGAINVSILSQGQAGSSCAFGMYKGIGRLSGNWLGTASETIVSDANKKHSVELLDDKYSTLFDLLLPTKFKYNDGTSDRYHTGFIAQDVESAITNAGLTTQDFAAFVTINANTEDVCNGLRYDEFVALNTWQIQKLKMRVAELERTVESLVAEH